MTKADLAQVGDIARVAFPDHHENPACFAERLALAPGWCDVLDDGTGAILGYLVAYPWPLGVIPPLNTPMGRLPDQRDALFLHDIAIRPEAAGSGQAGAMVEQLARRAAEAGMERIELVAVNDTFRFWHGHGFAIVEGSATPHAKLANYGAGAIYMRRNLAR